MWLALVVTVGGLALLRFAVALAHTSRVVEGAGLTVGPAADA